MDLLPNELIVEILDYVPISDPIIGCTEIHQFIKLELVCKTWRDLIRTCPWNVIVTPKKLTLFHYLLQKYTFRKFSFLKIILDCYNTESLNVLFPLMNKCTYLNLCTLRHHLNDDHLKYLQNINHLNISRCYKITGKYLESLSTLRSLALIYNQEFESEILSNLTQLRELSIDSCYQFTDGIFDNLTNLQTLELTYCEKLTTAYVTKLKSLRRFNALGCRKISKENVKEINLLIQKEINQI